MNGPLPPCMKRLRWRVRIVADTPGVTVAGLLPVGPNIVPMRAFARPGFTGRGVGLGLGPVRNRHKMRWCSGGRWFDANLSTNPGSEFQPPGQRAPGPNTWVRRLRGKAKLCTYAGTVQGRRRSLCRPRAGNLPANYRITRNLARQVVPVCLRMSMIRLPGFIFALTYHRLRFVRAYRLVFIASLRCCG